MDAGSLHLPPPISATAEDLPPAVAAALADPEVGRREHASAGGLSWSWLEWGRSGATPLLLVHGVTSSAAGWWRVGPALAAAGFRVVSPDQPGHGFTPWAGHVQFADNAADLAALVRALGLDGPELHVVGHSWGAMTVAELPAVGIRPRLLVLVDAPHLTPADLAAMLAAPGTVRYADLPAALAAMHAENPEWADRDIEVKAEALTQFDADAVRTVLLENQWDSGLAALAAPEAQLLDVWVVRGEPEAGGLVDDTVVPALASRLGPDRLLTIAGGPHSPHRTHPEATVAALLRTLGRDAR